MKTEMLTENSLSRAETLLRSGGLVAVPTETVYGLACDAGNAGAAERIYAVKGRPGAKPLSVLVPGPEAFSSLAEEAPGAAFVLAEKFWPGPLTLVLKASGAVPAEALAGGGTVGLRCPDHPLTLELLRRSGLALCAPSANPSGEKSPVSAGEVLGYFDGKIEAVLDGGVCGLGRESTVLDLSRRPYQILRQGALPEEEIAEALAGSMTLIGITGGSGSGKTTVLKALEKRGALVLDCDEVYHELSGHSAALREEICARFGPVYRGQTLDRKKLGAIVFHDKKALEDLNAITHKAVDAELHRRLREYAMAGGTLAAIDAIALLEGEFAGRTAFNLAVTAPAEVRVRRLLRREGVTEEYARSRIAAQHSDAYFKDHCDYCLENPGDDLQGFEQTCDTFFTEVLSEHVGRKKDGK